VGKKKKKKEKERKAPTIPPNILSRGATKQEAGSGGREVTSLPTLLSWLFPAGKGGKGREKKGGKRKRPRDSKWFNIATGGKGGDGGQGKEGKRGKGEKVCRGELACQPYDCNDTKKEGGGGKNDRYDRDRESLLGGRGAS